MTDQTPYTEPSLFDPDIYTREQEAWDAYRGRKDAPHETAEAWRSINDEIGRRRLAAERAKTVAAITPGLVRNDHPDTSRAAAIAVIPRTGTQRRRVFDFIASCGEDGTTDAHVQVWLEMDGNTERPRRVELVRDGLIVDSGRRSLVHGRPMIVWIVNPQLEVEL